MAALTMAEGMDDAEVLVPVPLTVPRLVRRGYNQSILLGKSMARHLDISLDSRVLKRVWDPGPQGHHSRSERRKRVRGCFAVGSSGRVRDRRVLLVDDVLTTGATVTECSRVLMAAGARKVNVIACARAVQGA